MELTNLYMDTHKIVQLLKGKGYSEEEAEGFIQAIQEITLTGVASKDDIQKIRNEAAETKNELKEDIAEVKNELKTDIANIKNWFLGIMLTQTLAIIAFTFALFQFFNR